MLTDYILCSQQQRQLTTAKKIPNRCVQLLLCNSWYIPPGMNYGGILELMLPMAAPKLSFPFWVGFTSETK